MIKNYSQVEGSSENVKCKSRRLELHLEIASKCILNCIHCSSNANNNLTHKMLLAEEIQNFIKFINNVEIFTCITGGEPLLSKDFFTIAEILNSMSSVKQIGFFSSGCVIDNDGNIQEIDEEFSNKLKRSGVTFSYMSMYSHISEMHDSVTRVSGSHQCLNRSIKNLIKAGIDVKANVVVMKNNYHNLEELIFYLNSLGVSEVRLLRLVNHGRAERYWGAVGLRVEEQEKAIKRVVDNLKLSDIKTRITIAGFPELMDCRPFDNGKVCQAGIGLLYVTSDGDVYPCACRKNDANSCIMSIREPEKTSRIIENDKKFNLNCFQDI